MFLLVIHSLSVLKRYALFHFSCVMRVVTTDSSIFKKYFSCYICHPFWLCKSLDNSVVTLNIKYDSN